MINRFRRAVRCASVAALALALAACGSSQSGGGSSKSVNIGVAASLSGPSTFPGFAHGAEAYFKAMNAKGGISGYHINYYVGDNANAGPQSVTVVRSMAQSHHIAGLIALGTVAANALIPLQPSLKIPMEVSADGDLYIPPKDGAYDAIPSYKSMWRYTTGLVGSHFKQQSLAYIYQTDAFGQPADDVISSEAQKDGLKVLTKVPMPNSVTSDFVPYASRLKASGAKVVLLALTSALDAGIIKAGESLGYHPIWVSTWNAEAPSVIAALGPSVMSRVFAVDLYPPVATTDSAAYTAYKTAMKKYYPKEVADQFAMQGWTYGSIFGYAITQLAKAHKDITPDALNKVIGSMNGVSVGLLPSLSYDSEGHQGITKMALLGYDNGNFKQVTDFTEMPAP